MTKLEEIRLKRRKRISKNRWINRKNNDTKIAGVSKEKVGN